MIIPEKTSQAISERCQFIDTHCHLDMMAYSSDLDLVLKNAGINHIEKIVTIGIDLPSSTKAVMIARKYSQVSATIGIHPHDVDNIKDNHYSQLEQLYLHHSQFIVGFGEIGLDYVKQHSDPNNQRKHFARQLDLAHSLKLPVIVHNREANEDTLKILRDSKGLDYGGIMHCFSGDIHFAHQVLDLGMMISIPGIVTFKNAHVLQEVARNIPLTSMILETDGPFLAPHPFRGKRNEPSYLLHTARKIAELREIDIEHLSRETTANAVNIFKFNKYD